MKGKFVLQGQTGAPKCHSSEKKVLSLKLIPLAEGFQKGSCSHNVSVGFLLGAPVSSSTRETFMLGEKCKCVCPCVLGFDMLQLNLVW